MTNERAQDTLDTLLKLEGQTLKPLREAVASQWVDHADPERALAEAWKRVYERPEHSRVRSGARRASALWYARQADMCDIVRLAREMGSDASPAQHALAEKLRKEAQTSFVFANDGYLRQEFVRRYGHSSMFESEDKDSAAALVLAEAREGLIDGMHRYDRGHAQQANALTYCGNWARQRVMKAIDQHSRLIPFKHAEGKRRRIVKAVRELQDASKALDVAVISQMTGVPSDEVLRLLPNSGSVGRLDSPVREPGSDGELTVGSTVADATVNLESGLQRDALNVAANRAVAEISDPMQRTVIEMLEGLGGREPCPQAALFDGVYVDRRGRQMAAKRSICTAAHRSGPDGRQIVQLVAQSELSARLRAGEVRFVPGTPQASELVRVAKAMGRSPWAPSSGSVQDAYVRACAAVRASQHLTAWSEDLRYRGDDEIENSQQALDELRRALVVLGVCAPEEAQRLKAGAQSTEGPSKKGSARLLGEMHGLIDERNGRLTAKLRDALSAPVSAQPGTIRPPRKSKRPRRELVAA